MHLIEQRGVLLNSAATKEQLFDVLARPYLAPLIAPASIDWLKRPISTAEPVTITERIVACRDPTDDKFPHPAVNGHADIIVTGDNDCLVLDIFRGIPIVNPAAFGQMPVF